MATTTHETGRHVALGEIRVPENVRALDPEHVKALAGSQGSGRGAVPALPPVRFLAPPSEPDVRVPAHPALHRACDGRL
jgi:hypothetical protein